MKLKSLISEGRTKLGKIEFTTDFRNDRIVLMARSSKDLDLLDAVKNSSNKDIRELLLPLLEKKSGLKFRIDWGYPGAGFAFKIEEDSILKLLENEMKLGSIVEDILNEGPAENKKVKALLDKHLKDLRRGGPNHLWAVMHILMGALSDANFHSESKKVAALFGSKAKYEGDPMAEKDLEEMYHYDLGPDVAKICQWDGKEIVNAMGFYISMTIGRPLGQKVEALVESKGMRLFKESVYLKEGRKSKDSAGVRYVEAIYNNSESITKMVLSDKKDAKEVVDTMGPVLINAIKAALAHNYKPNAQPAYTLKRDLDSRGDLSNQQRIDVFKKGLKELLSIVTELVKKPSKVGVKKLEDRFRQFWNREYGANIGLNGQGPHDNTIIESTYLKEAASRTAMEIGGLTGMNKDAIQKFVDDHKLDIEKVYQFVKKGKLSDRMDLVTAFAGKPNNPIQKKMISMFGESVTEGKKRFRQQNGIGKSKYTISYHDGVKKHKDGSDFFDIQIFKNQKDVDAFRKALLQKGFVEESVNEISYDSQGNLKAKKQYKSLSDYEKVAKKGDFIWIGQNPKDFQGVDKALLYKVVDKDSEGNAVLAPFNRKGKYTIPQKNQVVVVVEGVVNEANYKVYHKSFTEAAQEARMMAEKRGFEINEDDWQSQIALGGKNLRSRPGEGKTTTFTVGLSKDGKPQRKALQIQVYGMKNGYELNAYIN